MDTITTKLTYNGQHEDYEVVLKNNQPVTNVTMDRLGGTTSAGEFGTHDEARFSIRKPSAIRAGTTGRRCAAGATYVFAYDIEQENSKYPCRPGERSSTSFRLIEAWFTSTKTQRW